MASNLAKILYGSLSDFQRKSHTAGKDEDISTHFSDDTIKGTWYFHTTNKLKATDEGKDTIIYTINNALHCLLHTYIRQKFPAITVKAEHKDKVRIAWCHNVGINITPNADFRYNDEIICSMDSVSMEDHFQFHMKAGFRDMHNVNVGNVPPLEEWNTHLPQFPTSVPQPWFYSKSPKSAFPIHICGKKDVLRHCYRIKRSIKDLLRMQVLSGKEWKPIEVNFDYIDVDGNVRELHAPEMWGDYAVLTEAETKAYQCKDKISLHAEDVVICDSSNDTPLNSTAEVDLDCNMPCKAIYYKAENTTASAQQNYSNYTTCTQNVYGGKNPIKSISLKHGAIYHIENIESDHFSDSTTTYHFNSPPSERGYHAIPISLFPGNRDPDAGICFTTTKTKMIFKLGEGNYYESKGGDVNKVVTEKNPARFLVRVRLVIVKELNFIKSSAGHYVLKVVDTVDGDTLG